MLDYILGAVVVAAEKLSLTVVVFLSVGVCVYEVERIVLLTFPEGISLK